MKRFCIRILILLSLCSLVVFQIACKDEITCGCGDNWHPVKYPNRNHDRVSIPQGLWGDVWFWTGNFMPFCPSGTVTPVGREIRIHQLTRFDQVDQVDYSPFYREIRTPLVATAWSDADGFFQVALASGSYSIFSVEDTLFYSNRFDGEGNIFRVDVFEDSVTSIRFDITYDAAE